MGINVKCKIINLKCKSCRTRANARRFYGSLTIFANSVSRGERRGRRELIISTLRSLRTLREKIVLLNLQKLSKNRFYFIDF